MQLIRLVWESLIMAVQAVTTNRLRASLSLLGITIGIFAIIAVYTVVDSLETNIRESLNSLGSDVVYIEKWPWTSEDGQDYPWWKYMNRPVATLDEFDYIKAKSKSAEHICFISAVGRRIEYKNNNVDRADTLNGVIDKQYDEYLETLNVIHTENVFDNIYNIK